MFQRRRSFENEKLQLQELNRRLGSYLFRVKQLEQENALLEKEISTVRQGETVEWENRPMMELRELRRTVDQLAFEKSKAEMEREKLWRELQEVQEMRSKEESVCRNIVVEVKGCETQLNQILRTNQALEERLFQLENECKSLEEGQRQNIAHVRNQVFSRAIPVSARQNYQAPAALTAEEIEEYAQTLSDGWTETYEIYQREVEALEESIRADEAKLLDLQREKIQFAAEVEKLQSEAEKQKRLHAHLEGQLMNMQDKCHIELEQYQVLVEELEEERQAVAAAIAEKLAEHQELMQVKMGLSLEVAAYRALLEGETGDALVLRDQQTKGVSRRIDIMAPPPPYALKRSTVKWKDIERHPATTPAFHVRYMEPTSSLRSPSPSSQLRSKISSSTTETITSQRHHRSPLARRDMLSFTSTSQRQAATSSAPPTLLGDEQRIRGIRNKTTVDEKTRSGVGATQNSTNSLARNRQAGASHEPSVSPTPRSSDMKSREDVASGKPLKVEPPLKKSLDRDAPSARSPVAESSIQSFAERSVRVVSPPMMSLNGDAKIEDDDRNVEDVRQVIKVAKAGLMAENTPSKAAASHGTGEVEGSQNLTGGPWEHFDQNQKEDGAATKSRAGTKWDWDETDTGEEMFPEEQKVLHSISMEDIIETVVKPVGLDAKLAASPDSKVTYHVEKMEEEDGSAKTRITLQSRVTEELDMSDESALEELLSREGKTVTLEHIKGTPAGDMIENLLSLGLQSGGASLENKSINVEIVEEPVDDRSDEEIEEKSASKQASSFFQIEELDDDHVSYRISEGRTETTKASFAAGGDQMGKMAAFYEGNGDRPYFTQIQETEYFVSTPDENVSEPGEEGDFPSYGSYGAGDDWSDEQYYHKEQPPKTTRGDTSPNGHRSPKLIVKEEIRVSPSVQETMLGILRQDKTDTREQLRGTLEQLRGTVSVPLQEELDLFMRGDGEGHESLHIGRVQQVSDNGKVTIAAELKVSQTLEDSGLLEGGVEMSEAQTGAALRFDDPDFHHVISTSRGYTIRVSEDNEDTP